MADATGTTTYIYDTLDDLQWVVQSPQQRYFGYDSLKRMTQASNPESGITKYAYDTAGNLTSLTDNRGIVTGYIYDGLNRLTEKTYSDYSTPWIFYSYDTAGVPNAKGRLTQVQNGSSTTNYAAYDPLGERHFG